MLIFVDGEERYRQFLRKNDHEGVDFNLSAIVKPSSTVDFVVDRINEPSWDSTFLSVEISRNNPDQVQKPAVDNLPVENLDNEVVDGEPKPKDDELGLPGGKILFFLNDQTTVEMSQELFKKKVAEKFQPSLLMNRLASVKFEHDLHFEAQLEGYQEEVSDLINGIAQESQSPELAGLSVIPHHAKSISATLDLSGNSLLNLSFDANNANSADEIADGAEYFLNLFKGLQHVIPEENPLHSLHQQVIKGSNLKVEGESKVVLHVQMPVGLAPFIKNNAGMLMELLGGISKGPADTGLIENPNGVGHIPDGNNPNQNENQHQNLDPQHIDPKDEKTVYRDPPKDFPAYRDLTVRSYDCRVFFPGQPKFSEQNVRGEAGNIHVATFQGKTPRAYHVFEIYTYPKGYAKKTGDVLLRQTRDNLVDAPKGRLRSSEPIKYMGGTGLDIRYEHPEFTGAGQGHVRLVVRGDRVYMLEVDGVNLSQEEISLFHNSLAPYALKESEREGRNEPPPKIAEEEKAPLPGKEEIAAGLELVNEVYQDAIKQATTDQKKSDLAKLLLNDVAKVQEQPQRYAMLDVARKTAIDASDLRTSLDALEQMTDEFQLESLTLKSETLRELSKSRILPPERSLLVNEILKVADELVEEENFQNGISLLTLAQTQSRTMRDFTTLKQITLRLNDVEAIETKVKQLEPAFEKLKSTPEDPIANLAVGEFYCFFLGQFPKGLPLLIKSNNEKLKSLASADLAAPQRVSSQVKLGDDWWEYAEELSGLEQKQSKIRAVHWYEQALPYVTGLEKRKIEVRIQEMDSASGLNGTSATVNLLRLIDLRKHIVQGQWRSLRGSLYSSEDSGARVLIPYEAPEEYDLSLTVTRRSKNNHFCIGLTVDGVLAHILLDYQGSRRCAFFSAPPHMVQTGVFVNNKPTNIDVAVRTGSVKILINKRELLHWKKTASSFLNRLPSDWRMPDGTEFFVGSSSSSFQIQKIQLKPVKK